MKKRKFFSILAGMLVAPFAGAKPARRPASIPQEFPAGQAYRVDHPDSRNIEVLDVETGQKVERVCCLTYCDQRFSTPYSETRRVVLRRIQTKR
jgi:hypothetical protein